MSGERQFIAPSIEPGVTNWLPGTAEDWPDLANPEAVSFLPDYDELAAELELLRAELADVREDMAEVERERDEQRAAYTKWRSELFAAVGRTGTKFDRELMRAFDR